MSLLREDRAAPVAINLRPYEARDAAAVTEIDEEYQRENGRGIPRKPYLRPPDYDDIEGTYTKAGGAFWVVENGDGVIVAFGGVLRVDGRTGRLRRVRVRASWRRRGIAVLLLEQSERFCRDQGITRVTLGTAEDNLGAQEFYRRHGYVEVGQSRAGDFREIEFAKALTSSG